MHVVSHSFTTKVRKSPLNCICPNVELAMIAEHQVSDGEQQILLLVDAEHARLVEEAVARALMLKETCRM
mgnify:CR=1 FL=1